MKRALALIMAAMIVSLSVMNTYKITAEAAMSPGIVGPGLYNTFSIIFGHSMGLGDSTDNMTSNHIADNITYFIGDLAQMEPATWNDYIVNPEESARRSFLTLLLAGKNAYDACVDTYGYNPLLYALDKKSYSATGTVFSKEAQTNINEAIERYENMSDAEFDSIISGLYTVFTDENSIIDASNLSKIRMLYDDLMIGTIGVSSYEDNEWIKPIDSTIYEFNDLGVAMIQVDGIEYKISRLLECVGTRYDMTNETWKYIFDRPVLCIGLRTLRESTGQIVVYQRLLSMDKPYFTAYKRTKAGGSFNYVTAGYMDSAVADGRLRIIDMMGSTEGSSTFISNLSELVSQSEKSSKLEAISVYIADNNILTKENAYLDDSESISTIAPELDEALDDLWNKQLTVNDIVDLAERLEAIESTAGTDTAIDDLTATINGLATTLPDAVVDGKNDVVQAVEGLGEVILTLPKAIWLQFEGTLEAIKTKALTTTRPWEDGENKENSNDILPIFNGLIILIMIVVALLKIFIHCLQFIINIFAIPASSDLLPEEMRLGLEYINTIEIPIIGMSVYSFMMGLVYILIVFYAIRILRINVDRIKIPKQKTGGM